MGALSWSIAPRCVPTHHNATQHNRDRPSPTQLNPILLHPTQPNPTQLNPIQSNQIQPNPIQPNLTKHNATPPKNQPNRTTAPSPRRVHHTAPTVPQTPGATLNFSGWPGCSETPARTQALRELSKYRRSTTQVTSRWLKLPRAFREKNTHTKPFIKQLPIRQDAERLKTN